MGSNKRLTGEDIELSQVIIENANIVAYGVVAPLIFAIGLAGNLATLVTLANTTKFSGRIYTYIRALALSDLTCIIFCVIAVSQSKFSKFLVY